MSLKLFLYNQANRFRNNKVIYTLLKPIWGRYVKKENKRRIANFHKNGLEAIRALSEACYNNNVMFWLDFGTLLGAIREHDFIKHDNDIDVGSEFEQRDKFRETIVNAGFVLMREFRIIENGEIRGLEETYEFKGVFIDIFYYIYHTDHSRILYTFTPILDDPTMYDRAEIKKTVVPYYGFKESEFKGIPVNVPKDEDSYLKFHYGKNYMIPDPNYKSSDVVKSIQYIDRSEKTAEFKVHQWPYA